MRRDIIVLIAAPAALLIGILLFVVYMNRSAPIIESTDTSQYKVFLAKWPLPELTSHFPQSLPWQGDHFQMLLDPGGLQEAARIELRMHLPPDDFEKLAGRYEPRKSLDGSPATAPVEWQMADEAVPLIRISGPNGKPIPLPPEYHPVYLTAEERGNGNWSHGRLSGIAIADATQQVIYFAAAW